MLINIYARHKEKLQNSFTPVSKKAPFATLFFCREKVLLGTFRKAEYIAIGR